MNHMTPEYSFTHAYEYRIKDVNTLYQMLFIAIYANTLDDDIDQWVFFL